MLKNLFLAKGLREEIGDMLMGDAGFVSLLTDLKRAIETTRLERLRIGMTSECERCGSFNRDCCGSGIELRYTVELLLLNLLLGVEIPERRELDDSCYFLTSRGCCLLARHVFCVNYLCRRLLDLLPVDTLSRLQRLEGIELEIIFRLEEMIKTLKRHKG
jgi:hypothetical protein